MEGQQTQGEFLGWLILGVHFIPNPHTFLLLRVLLNKETV